MTKDIIKKALGLAEKENQEKEVQRVKKIIQKHLEEIDSIAKEQAKLTKRSKILKLDLDDIKQGRLDRIEERQEKDKEAKKYSVIVVKKVVKEYIPLQPWFSPYYIEYNPCHTTYYAMNGYDSSAVTTYNAVDLSYMSADSGSSIDLIGLNGFTVTGSNCSTFAKGSYDVGDHNINLR